MVRALLSRAGFLLLIALAAAGCSGISVTAPTPQRAVPSTPVAQLAQDLNAVFQPPLPTPIPDAYIEAADAEYLLLQNLYARLVPSVVNVDVTVNQPQATLSLRDSTASGSGFVYSDQGHIITNAHVVNDARTVRVTFHDGYVADAAVIGYDVYSDLAVLRVDVPPERLYPVTFADSSALRVGQRAVAIGNPFGLASSMTVGIISALGRQLPSAELIRSTIGGFSNPNIIQVDADINPGNSGGPLLNSAGHVIGVNTAIRSVSGIFEGVGFAVPSATVMRVVPEIIENGQVDYAWMGISSISTEGGFGVAGLAEPLNLPVTQGVLVDGVSTNSPAAEAGLRGGTRSVLIRGREVCAGGDIIVAINDTPVGTMDELMTYLVVNSRPGDEVILRIIRGQETFDLPLTLRARPADDFSSIIPPCGA